MKRKKYSFLLSYNGSLHRYVPTLINKYGDVVAYQIYDENEKRYVLIKIKND